MLGKVKSYMKSCGGCGTLWAINITQEPVDPLYSSQKGSHLEQHKPVLGENLQDHKQGGGSGYMVFPVIARSGVIPAGYGAGAIGLKGCGCVWNRGLETGGGE